MSDSMIDTFKALLAQGMTHAEALREFDEESWKKAVREMIDMQGPCEILDLYAVALRGQQNERDMELAIELWMNGWKSELPNAVQTDVMSWSWRSPPKRKNSNGRLYSSTNQAFNAMKKGK